MFSVPALVELVTTAGGRVAAVAATFAAAWRFLAWLRDRSHQGRTESASFFFKDGAAPWHKAFGEAQLVRLHFARLTGIDRSDGHAKLFLLHQRLGGTSDDWTALRRAGSFVKTAPPVATIRKTRGSDHLTTIIAIVLGAFAAWSSLSLTNALVQLLIVTDWSKMTFDTIAIMVLLAAYAAVFAVFAWGGYLVAQRNILAPHIRRRLSKKPRLPRVARRVD